MNEQIVLGQDDYSVVFEEYTYDICEHFSDIPDIAKPLIGMTKSALSKIESMLYTAPAFINAVKANMPDIAFQAILTDKQKTQLAKGALELMTKKDGSLMANLVNPKTKKIVSTVSLE